MPASKLFTSQEASPTLLQQGKLLAGVPIAVLQTESHNFTANVPKIALESGAQVSDHMILEPPTVTVSFVITNAGDGKQRATDAFNAFKKMMDERQLVEVVTEHMIYTDMVLTSLTPMHSAPYKGALTCSATFTKINFVKLESAGQAPKNGSKTSKTASAQKNGGRVEAKEYKRSGAIQWADGLLNKKG